MHDLSLYLLELLENSLRAEAKHIAVTFFADRASNRLRLLVEDDGQGLQTSAQTAVDPFYTTKESKKTGLGLSLLRAEAEAAGGWLDLRPAPEGNGVRVEVEMQLDHVDRVPVGDLFESLRVMAATHPETTFLITLAGDEFDTPVQGSSLATVREPLQKVTRRLDQELRSSASAPHDPLQSSNPLQRHNQM